MMGVSGQQRFDIDRDAHLLQQFPPQAVSERLPIIDFAAWKLPLERHAHGSTALSRQDKALSFNDRASDMDVFSDDETSFEVLPILPHANLFPKQN
jgi:hypothetical protein